MESKTVILQPTFHSNSRTEFRVNSDDKVISSKLRLCNFGVASFTAAAGGAPMYNLGSGVYGCIKQITLYSGGVILDELKDASRWLGMMNLVGQTDSAWDVKQKMLCSGLNIRHDELIQLPSQLQLQVQQTKFLGRVLLQSIFPMLNSEELLVGFKELRVVIEYNTDVSQIFQATNQPTNIVFNQPIMVYDEVVTESGANVLVSGDKSSWEYLAIEREVINIPASAAGTPQTVSIRLRGSDQKQVSNMYLQVLPGGTADPQLGYAYSCNMPTGDDRFNFILNSRRLIPQNGFNSASRKSASMADVAQGGFNVFTQAHDVASTTAGVYNALYDTQLIGLFNKLAFVNVDINEKIDQLDLEFYRPALAGAGAALTVFVWYRVIKQGSNDDKGNITTMYSL